MENEPVQSMSPEAQPKPDEESPTTSNQEGAPNHTEVKEDKVAKAPPEVTPGDTLPDPKPEVGSSSLSNDSQEFQFYRTSSLNKRVVKPVDFMTKVFQKVFVTEERRAREGVTSTVCPNPTQVYHRFLLMYHEPLRMAMIELNQAFQSASKLHQVQKIYIWSLAYFSTFLKFYLSKSGYLFEKLTDVVVDEDSQRDKIFALRSSLAAFYSTQYDFDFEDPQADPDPATQASAVKALTTLENDLKLLVDTLETTVFPQLKKKVAQKAFNDIEFWSAQAPTLLTDSTDKITGVIYPWIIDSASIWMDKVSFDNFMREEVERSETLKDHFQRYISLNRRLIDSVIDNTEDQSESKFLTKEEVAIHLKAEENFTSLFIISPSNDLEKLLILCSESVREYSMTLESIVAPDLFDLSVLDWKEPLFFEWFDTFSRQLTLFNLIFKEGFMRVQVSPVDATTQAEQMAATTKLCEKELERWDRWLETIADISTRIKLYNSSSVESNLKVVDKSAEVSSNNAEIVKEGTKEEIVQSEVPVLDEKSNVTEKELKDASKTSSDELPKDSLSEPADIKVGFADAPKLSESLDEFRELARNLNKLINKLNDNRECFLSYYLTAAMLDQLKSTLKECIEKLKGDGYLSELSRLYPVMLKACSKFDIGEDFVKGFFQDFSASSEAYNSYQKMTSGLLGRDEQFARTVTEEIKEEREKSIQRMTNAEAPAVANHKGCCVIA
jgi:hypothetical protein